jgi:hypothetical protein
MTWGRASDFRMHGVKKIKRDVIKGGKARKKQLLCQYFSFLVCVSADTFFIWKYMLSAFENNLTNAANGCNEETKQLQLFGHCSSSKLSWDEDVPQRL